MILEIGTIVSQKKGMKENRKICLNGDPGIKMKKKSWNK